MKEKTRHSSRRFSAVAQQWRKNDRECGERVVRDGEERSLLVEREVCRRGICSARISFARIAAEQGRGAKTKLLPLALSELSLDKQSSQKQGLAGGCKAIAVSEHCLLCARSVGQTRQRAESEWRILRAGFGSQRCPASGSSSKVRLGRREVRGQWARREETRKKRKKEERKEEKCAFLGALDSSHGEDEAYSKLNLFFLFILGAIVSGPAGLLWRERRR